MNIENIEKLLDKCNHDYYQVARYVANTICEGYLCMPLDCVSDTFELMNIIENYASAIEQYAMEEITNGVMLSDYLEFKSDIIYQVQKDILL